MAQHYQATLVSHTHWDRAWYCTFQEFRIRLVRLVDNLLRILKENPDFHYFMLDGQMSVIEDYLEVRPEKAAELQALCRSGRIQVGPWFVLADEFLVSPESLIRNLRLGHRMGEAFGGVEKIGYVPDGFGHIAQLPQILRGFGIDNAFFWRGMGKEGDRLGTEFMWKGIGGEAVTTILMPWGYHNVTNLGYGIHWGDVSQMIFNPVLAQEKIERAINKLTPMANTDGLLLMNGIDHAEPEALIPQIIAHANDELENATVTHGRLRDHLARVRGSGKALELFEGEFRWGRYSEILQGVYSTRIHLKQANHKGEVLLERYMEPLSAMAWLSGAAVPEGVPSLADVAWHWLMLNHPHDDIYGSGIDEVHHEMDYRFSQSRQIGEALVRDSLRWLAREVDYTGQTGIPIIVYNALGWGRSEVAQAEVDFEFDDSLADSFQIVDAKGAVVPHQVVRDEQVFWMEVLKPNRKRRVQVLLPVRVPACGYTTLYVQPRSGASPAAGLTVSERQAENAFLKLSVADDGGLTVVDKATGKTYSQLNHFFDVEDTGDEYTYCPLQHNSQPVSTIGQAASITCVESGPLRALYRIERVLPIPSGLTADRQMRAGDTVPLPIISDVAVFADQPGVYIRTTIHNAAHDHKLTVNFPSGVQAAQAYVDESFMVAERDLQLPDSTGWVEDPTALMHQRTFTDLSNDGAGLAVLNRGLPSVEVYQDGTIALTLLRCVGWLSRDDLWVRRIAAGPLVPTPGAQCLGDYEYEYAILPHAGGWQQVYAQAHNYNVPLFARRADTHPGLELHEMNITRDDPAKVTKAPWPRGGKLADHFSFVTLDAPELTLSAAYRSGEHLFVRCYNVTRQPVRSVVTFGLPVQQVERALMNEEGLEVLPLQNGKSVVIEVMGGEVYTLKISPV
jgi:mannosylglycerate hydrolase